MTDEKTSKKIIVRGIVQGVGFRPTVYGYATKHNLTGWIRNISSGVEIQINGQSRDIDIFLQEIQTMPPPLAKIDEFQVKSVPPDSSTTFEILASLPTEGDFLPISPDIAICPDCLREMQDPGDRRYRYPFINCTNCGPRYTIIKDIPYDRPKTSMAAFEMCPQCKAEYNDPLNRRYHAQPTACPECGPQVTFISQKKVLAHKMDAIALARDWLRNGKIVAVKGLGGYHLACDAENDQAVEILRKRKKRSQKAFALMSFDQKTIEHHCYLNKEETRLLSSPAHPIVILNRKKESTIVEDVAPRQNTLGFMLPYTPLHYLLLEPEDGFPEVLVMTSGNLSEEPIAFLDEDAAERLEALADGFLINNRKIHIRIDDSVTRVIFDNEYPIRRSRGYSPSPIQVDQALPPILGVGAELKNTIALSRDKYIFLSHFIGDLENFETNQSFEEAILHTQKLFRIHPEYIACDLHPNYLSTQYAKNRSCDDHLPLFEIQHHHAHLSACLADNQYFSDAPVIGLCFDGTGLGTDNTIWGGEILIGNHVDFQRVYHLNYVPLPGGEITIKKPARMALACLWRMGLEWDPVLPPVQALTTGERRLLFAQLDKQINIVETSSMGRLFDAVSSLIGICHESSYEGQAAIELEAMLDLDEKNAYPIDLDGDKIDFSPAIRNILADFKSRISISIISTRFHNTLVNMVIDNCGIIRKRTGIKTVALSGGVWQNRYLLEKAIRLLKKNHFDVLFHHKVPTNDACIALGQVMIASRKLKGEKNVPGYSW